MDSTAAPTLDRARFRDLWRRCAAGSAPDAQADAIFAELAAHYREPHRYYHTAAHIDECLSRMDAAADVLGRSDEVELAIWFHDVIYTPGARDNEARSAQWFTHHARGALADDLVDDVVGYIHATTHCQAPEALADPRAQYVVDVDLSGMGMDAESFQRDGDNIRKEAAGLSDAEFCRCQGAFLRKLLARERIYATDFFHNWCEARARENIHAALARYDEVVRAADGGDGDGDAA